MIELIEILNMIGSVTLITIFMYSVKLIYDYKLKAFTGQTSIDLFDEQHYAFLILVISLFMSIGTAMLGTINGDFVMQAVNGLIGMGFIIAAIIISDRIIFPDIDDLKEIVINNNIAMAIVQGSFIFATGTMAYASFAGTGPLWTSFVYFIIGQIILLTMSKVYGNMHTDLLDNIKKNRIGSAILLGSMFISFAFIIKGAMIGDYVSFLRDMEMISISIVAGVLMMLIFVNKIIDRFFIPEYTLKEMIADDNIPSISIIAIVKIMLSLVIGYVAL